MKAILILCIIFTTLNSCTKEDINPEKIKIGAICRDGTKTSSTGSGTCSYHGGVKEWIYGIPTPNYGRNY